MQAYPKLGSLSAMANPLSKEPNSYKELVGWAAPHLAVLDGKDFVNHWVPKP